MAKAQDDSGAAQIRAGTSLVDAFQTLNSLRCEADSLKHDLLPTLEQAFHASDEGFRRGKLQLLEVLEVQRSFFEMKGRYIEVLAAYHKATADMERLIGGP